MPTRAHEDRMRGIDRVDDSGRREAASPNAPVPDDAIAVTGLGVYCATGRSVPEFLHALRDGRASFRRISEFDVEGCRTELAAMCDDVPDLPTRSGARANALLR